MAAVQVLQHVNALFEHDAGMIAGGPAVAHDQLVLGVPADAERQRLKLHARAMPAGIGHDEGRGPRALAGLH